jgi:hypothetical protein
MRERKTRKTLYVKPFWEQFENKRENQREREEHFTMPLPGLTGTPSPGRLHLSCSVQGAEVIVGTTAYRADFHGSLKIVLDSDQLAQFRSGVISLVPLLIQEQIFDGIGDSIGSIMVRKDLDRDPLPSTLTAIIVGHPFPAIQEIVINSHVVIPNLLPGITLRNKILPDRESAVLRDSQAMSFPPKNGVYTLVEPMELEDVNNPGSILATIKSFPLTVNF